MPKWNSTEEQEYQRELWRGIKTISNEDGEGVEVGEEIIDDEKFGRAAPQVEYNTTAGLEQLVQGGMVGQGAYGGVFNSSQITHQESLASEAKGSTGLPVGILRGGSAMSETNPNVIDDFMRSGESFHKKKAIAK